MSDSASPIRVVVFGPAGCGKTSFCVAAAADCFPERAPPVLPPTLLPPAPGGPSRRPLLLLDTSSRAEEREALGAALRRADVLVLCFALDAPGGAEAQLQRLRDDWLPELARAPPASPLLLLGLRADAEAATSASAAAAALQPLCPRLGCALECSARTLQAVPEALFHAADAVLHPVAPLFDSRAQALPPDALAALRRLFRLADADGDGLLSLPELNGFQAGAYGQPLSAGEAEDLLAVVAAAGLAPPPPQTGLTLSAFLYLQAMLIQRGRCDAVWAALAAAGHGPPPSLALRPDALGPRAAHLLGQRPADAAVELSERGVSFLSSQHARCAVGSPPLLHAPQLEALFATAPGGAAAAAEALGWGEGLGAGEPLSERAFLALWAAAAAMHPRAAMEQLAYLCFPGDVAGALRLSRRRAAERLAAAGWRLSPAALPLPPPLRPRGPPRGLLQLCLLGPDVESGEALLRWLAAADGGGAKEASWACGSLEGAGGGAVAEAEAGQSLLTPPPPATLLLRLPRGAAAAALAAQPELRAAFDAFLFLFDSNSEQSFEAAAGQCAQLAAACGREALGSPALLVATRAAPPATPDGRLPWDREGRCAAFCHSLGIAEPLFLEAGTEGVRELLAAAAAAAAAPHPALPETRAARARRLRRGRLRRAAAYAAAGCALGAAGLLLFRLLREPGEEAGEGGAADEAA